MNSQWRCHAAHQARDLPLGAPRHTCEKRARGGRPLRPPLTPMPVPTARDDTADRGKPCRSLRPCTGQICSETADFIVGRSRQSYPPIADISRVDSTRVTPQRRSGGLQKLAIAVWQFAAAITYANNLGQETSAVVLTLVSARCVGITMRCVSTVVTSARILLSPAATNASIRSASDVRYTPAR